MKAKTFAHLRALTVQLSDSRREVTVFGNWRNESTREVVKLEARTAELVQEDTDVFFAGLDAPVTVREAINELLQTNLKTISAWHVDRDTGVEHYIVGRTTTKVWIGVKYIREMPNWNPRNGQPDALRTVENDPESDAF